jgi:hypothetical protein
MESTIFWDITPLSVNQRFGGIYRLFFKVEKITSARNLQVCQLLSRWFLAELIFSTLKMEAICPSETSVDTQRATRHYIPEDGAFKTPIILTQGFLGFHQ